MKGSTSSPSAPLEYTQGIVLAPMAGYTDSAFRRICKRLGATCLVTEMIASAGLSSKSERTRAMLSFTDEEKPIGVQLFGSDPEHFAKAARIVSDMGFAFIDINAGCPAKKVVSRGSGSALLRDIPRLRAIVRATGENTELPVTVKIRLGWSPSEPIPDDLPAMLGDDGASALTVHGRFRCDIFSGTARVDAIASIVENSPIPVLANGESRSVEAALSFLHSSGAGGLLVGRGALGNPWIFRGFSGSPREALPRPGELHETIMEQLEMMSGYIPQQHLYHIMRGHLVLYFRGFRGASAIRDRAVHTECREEVEELAVIADDMVQEHIEHAI